jgi:hypothetical protein
LVMKVAGASTKFVTKASASSNARIRRAEGLLKVRCRVERCGRL